MSKLTRIIAAILCVGLLVGLVALSFFAPDDNGVGTVNVAGTAMSNNDCRQCHQAVWEEWSQSMHAVSWTSPDVKAAFQHFGHDRKCESCHAPVPVFVSGVANPVELRAANREEGVGCLSCHLLPDGSVAARNSNPDAPCRPVATPELATSAQCAGCHRAIHDDWKQSKYAEEGKTCQSCHMPVEKSRSVGFSHLCLGGHDDELVRSAAQLICEVRADELLVTVRNLKAGHNFPGERHNRVLLVEVIETSADGDIVFGGQKIIKDITPFRGESSSEQIRAGEAAEMKFEVVEGTNLITVRLLYKRFPWISDRDALVVHQAEMEIK